MKRVFFGIFFTLFTLAAVAGGGNAKSRVIKGKVVDDEGNPVTGAKVVLLDSKKEVYTDFEGTFVFKDITPEQKSIKVSYLSYDDTVAHLNLKEVNNTKIELQIQSK